MLIAVAFVVLMVMFGNNPMDEWRAEQEKYGKDPLVREINKFNDKQRSSVSSGGYKPPPGSYTYSLPYNSAPVSSNPFAITGKDEVFHPAAEVPIEQWDSPYPSYMVAPDNNSGAAAKPIYPKKGGTSLMPGSR